MQRIRQLAEKFLTFSDRPTLAAKDRPVFWRLAIPHSFGPNLSFGQALVAVVGCLTRIFCGCLLFAVWGGGCALALSVIGSPVWRALVLLALVFLFLAGLATLLLGITALERMIAPKR